MKNNMKVIRGKLMTSAVNAIDALQKNQLVQFKAHGKEYVYACVGGKEHWAVPVEERDGLKKLMRIIRQLDEKSEGMEIDELIVRKFMSKYYRMRSDIFEAAHSLLVGYPDDETAEESRARIYRATEKMRSLDKLLSAANGRNKKR
jgi:hypothetical protein